MDRLNFNLNNEVVRKDIYSCWGGGGEVLNVLYYNRYRNWVLTVLTILAVPECVTFSDYMNMLTLLALLAWVNFSGCTWQWSNFWVYLTVLNLLAVLGCVNSSGCPWLLILLAVPVNGNSSGCAWLCHSSGCAGRVLHQLISVSATGSVEYADTQYSIQCEPVCGSLHEFSRTRDVAN
jgi:hypothetical protein